MRARQLPSVSVSYIESSLFGFCTDASDDGPSHTGCPACMRHAATLMKCASRCDMPHMPAEAVCALIEHDWM